MSDIDPPNGYTISGEGSGGAAGFAKGGAKVRFDDPGGTKLNFTVDATVGGKLAQIGSRLIDSTAKKMANDFFGKFAELAESRMTRWPRPKINRRRRPRICLHPALRPKLHRRIQRAKRALALQFGSPA